MSEETKAELAQLMGQLANKKPPNRLKGHFGGKSAGGGPSKYLVDQYSQKFEFGEPQEGSLETWDDPLTGRMVLMGKPLAPQADLIENLKAELEVDNDTWYWEFNKEVARPIEGQYFLWNRSRKTENAPDMDGLVMVNHQLYILTGREILNENNFVVGIKLVGKTEKVARKEIREWRKRIEQEEA